MRLLILGITLLFLFGLQTKAFAAQQPWVVAAGQDLLIKFKSNAHVSIKTQTQQEMGVIYKRSFKTLGGIEHWKLSVPMDVNKVIAKLKNNPDIEYIEPNYPRYLRVLPNDIEFGKQWGLHNTGQFVGSLAGVDMKLPAAWDINTGSPKVIIAVIDDSVDINHEDLYANIWTNMGEIPDNGIDDDNNGYIDDVHGWDFVKNDNDPSADSGTGEGHGTMVAGCIGAVGNNGLGVSGVMWDVSIMPLKFLGDVVSELAAIDYAIANGAHIVNASWGGPQFSYAESEGMKKMLDAGVLLVAAAGNFDGDNDRVLDYPSGLPYPNILAVSAIGGTGNLTSWSHYGDTSVDVAAPGHTIYTTSSTNIAKGLYDYTTGTSFSAPLTAGVAGLVWAKYPASTFQDIKGRILAAATPMTQHGLSATDAYVNAAKALSINPRPELVISALDLTDDNNNLMDPNESLKLSITLENVWQPATGISGVLSTTDPLVSINAASVSWPSLAKGAQGKSISPFTINMQGFSGYRLIPFVLSLTTAEGVSFKRYFSLSSGLLESDVVYHEKTMQNDQDEFQYFHFDVPQGSAVLNITTASDADIDVLLRFAANPQFDYSLYAVNPVFGYDSETSVSVEPKTGNEQIIISNPHPGTWHAVVVSFDKQASSYSVQVSTTSTKTLGNFTADKLQGEPANPSTGAAKPCLTSTLITPFGFVWLFVLALYVRRRA